MQLTALAMWLNTTFAVMDESVAVAVHQLFLSAGAVFTPILTLFTRTLDWGGTPFILASIVLIWFPKTRRYGVAMLSALAIGALITNICFKPLAARPRPYTWDGSVFQQIWEEMGCPSESDKSFPSGHMCAAMALATAVFLRGDRKISWTAFLYAALVGLSRVYLGVHYFSDVLGGVFVGLIGGVLGYIISVRVPEDFYALESRDMIRAIPHTAMRVLPRSKRKKGRHER